MNGKRLHSLYPCCLFWDEALLCQTKKQYSMESGVVYTPVKTTGKPQDFKI